MKKHNLVFLDLETTGLNPEMHEIIEIGCIIARQKDRVGKGPEIEKIEEFEIKVKPRHIETADKEALRICGYNEGDWVFAVDLKQALGKLAEKAKSGIMVGHNVAFDWVFLEKAFEETGVVPEFHYHKIDTIALAFAKLYNNPEAQKFSLRALCELLNIKNEKAHTALSDVRATFELYKKLLGA
jgi:DNA polymerase III alpha subunit (gram-positive type)